MPRRAVLLLIAAASIVLAPWALPAAEASDGGLVATIVTADDEEIRAKVTGLADGQLHLATDPPRTIAIEDVARIDVTELEGTQLAQSDLVWIGQDNHDLVQVGSASGGNGIQDIHLHATNLRSVNLRQVLVVCRFPGQLRVWRLDTSQSPHWRVAVDRDGGAGEAELYLEPGSIDSFHQRFDVTYTYSDGITTKAFVVADTHTIDKLKIDAEAAPGTAAAAGAAPASNEAREVSVTLAGGDALGGKLAGMTAETVTLDKGWSQGVEIPLLHVKGVWCGHTAPAGARDAYDERLAAPAGKDVVFVLAPDGQFAPIDVNVRGLADGKLRVLYRGQERQINEDRVLGIVLAAHPPIEKLDGVVQMFRFAAGDVLTGRWVDFGAGNYVVETSWGTRLQVPADRVGQIRIRGGKVTSLADLEPVGVEETPYFGRVIHWARDTGFEGGPPQLRGKQPMRSLAMHSRCVLTYDLDGQYDHFRARLGFDDTAGELGRVNCRVLVDGREQFARDDFRAVNDPVDVEVDLSGARQLTLVVDFGPDEDVGDRVLWSEPRLYRASDGS